MRETAGMIAKTAVLPENVTEINCVQLTDCKTCQNGVDKSWEAAYNSRCCQANDMNASEATTILENDTENEKNKQSDFENE